MQNKTIEKILNANSKGLFRSDDDLMDWAKRNRLKFDDVLECIANNEPNFKKCWGCKFIINRCYEGTYSKCSHCTRRIESTDNFVLNNKRYRMHQGDTNV